MKLRSKAPPVKAESWADRLHYAMLLLYLNGYMGQAVKNNMRRRLMKELAKQDKDAGK